MDYLGRLLLAIERARPWNGAAICTPGTWEDLGYSEYAITPFPMFHATSYIAFLTRHTRRQPQPRPW